MSFKDEVNDDLLLAIELSKSFNRNEDQSCVFDTDSDFEYALKLSQQLNGYPENSLSSLEHNDAFVQSTPSINLMKNKLHLNKFESDIFDETQVVENGDSTKRKDSFELTSSKETRRENTNYEFPSDISDKDLELAIQLSEESFNLKSVGAEDGLESFQSELDQDFLLALQFAEQDSDVEEIDLTSHNNGRSKHKLNMQSFQVKANSCKINTSKYSDHSLSIVDPSWETLDPNPDIYALFVAFNKRFFWGRLDMVEIRWSSRMTLCAGICSYRSRAGHCIVSLSKPLLSYRPRKDLVETLLHEMIHAYLFITKNDRDRDGHGAEFHKHMNRINNETGTKISVFHSFHDEVRSYKIHWWKCDGPCQYSAPFFGMVKRSMNRAPGPNDLWWTDHLATCGGKYHKIREPKGYGQKKGIKRKNAAPDTEIETLSNVSDPWNRSSSSSTKESAGSVLGSSSSTGNMDSTIQGTFNWKPSYSSSDELKSNIPKNFQARGNQSAKISSPSYTGNAELMGPPQNTRTLVPKFSNNKIFTLPDLAKNKKKSTTKKWVPLHGQKKIFQFFDKS